MPVATPPAKAGDELDAYMAGNEAAAGEDAVQAATRDVAALEKERKLRHEAEYRLDIERNITSYVCHELRNPFNAVASASFVSRSKV